ncbi:MULTISPECIES: sodium/sugar symporter [Pseudoalteromonas]|uniref:Sodium/hexose cotransport protein n=2 Tax=Pseudoalteromonas TaxID=53246 RepID=Q3IH83_PSET1|nr:MULTISPECIES: sodium/sugar symporter [Pseudoalteromonas]ASM54402.1 solute:Na+ symporter, SSS family [Pseudoalteromonas nigrifaciens]MBB1404600.1 sodium/sugar symporter [Pseudoalteromonas sp. SG44-5]MBH0072613.1 sodium/sugar symporter [Pseudoalteromonas sp. NZS127]MBH0092956.1 sodium/sugar symporter [Pseudoalteromonas sp. SCQQ13]MBO7924822.1 sodium/sugar symporter [Pseudoalteromonas sp. K222D]
MKLQPLDIAIFFTYVVGLLVLALWISREEKGASKNTEDYFLASKALPWWAIGASLIASNISAEQIIGMSGSGYAIGLAIASYEWMAAITLIIVGKYMLPIFLKNEIFTMPQYLEQRFDSKVKTVLALFWLAVYVFVNLTAVLWLGGLAIETVAGVDWMYGMIFLALFSVAYSLYGGLKAVAYTDILQVVLLVFGGLFLSYLALDAVADGDGIIAGFGVLTEQLPNHFDMILSPDSPHYMSLPGLSVLIGGLWIMNISYWGFNQYIIQRALAAKNLKEAQKGIAFAAYLKLLMPVIVVLPGIAAVVLYPQLTTPDQAYPSMMALMPTGIKGLIFAALVAAIVSSLASMTNSISTIFTMDIYSKLKPGKSQKHYVFIGRSAALISLAIALVVAEPLLGKFDQAFQYIQEFTGFFTPGIVVIFVMGMFWSKASSAGALAAAIGSAVFSILLKVYWVALPFMDRVGLVFLLCLALCVIVSLAKPDKGQDSSVSLDDVNFKTSSNFNIAALGVVIILIALYTTWW